MTKNEINTVQTIKPLNDQRIFLFSEFHCYYLRQDYMCGKLFNFSLRKKKGEKRRDG